MLTRQLNLNSFRFRTLLNCQNTSTRAVSFHASHNAPQVFDKVPQRNPPSISNSMLTYIHQNLNSEALGIFKSQIHHHYPHGIDEDLVAVAIKACCRGNVDPRHGNAIHAFAVCSGYILHLPVLNSLMNLYCKRGNFDVAFDMFMHMADTDIVSYNTILAGFSNTEDALSFACQMNLNGVVFDHVSCSTILAFCTDNKGFLLGKQLHSMILKSGLDCEVYVGNALISMYSRWDKITEAERVFHEMPNKDFITWNAILSGYSQEGNHFKQAISVFLEIMRRGIKLDHVSLTSAVSACGHEHNLETGKQVHALSLKAGYGSNVSVCNVLMSTYAKCEVCEDAKMVFQDAVGRNVVSWTTMITIDEANGLSLFHEMREDGVHPNDVTFIGVLHAITMRNSVNAGKMVHGLSLKTGFVSESNVSNSLVTMYAKFESIGDSVKVFEELSYKETVSWNAMISAYAQNGLPEEALEAFFSAIAETQPSEHTFGAVLSAIADAEAIPMRHGQICHAHLLKLGLNTNLVVSGVLLDMYAKRGSLSESKRIFEELNQRSQVAWTAILSAHATHGDYDSVMNLFKEMEREGVKPDQITFLAVLTACGRKGMIDMGRQIFDTVIKDHMIDPSPELYSCMVDMLGRVGRVNEAEELMHQIPAGPPLSALQSLLGSCRIHGDVEMAERAADALMDLEPNESGSYVLMSNLYAEKGNWEKVAKIRRMMRDKGVKKVVGLSWVDVCKTHGFLYMHKFSSGDKSHPQAEEIHSMAKCLGFEMKLLEKERRNDTMCSMDCKTEHD